MRRLLCVLVIALVVGACGGDDDDSTDSANGSVARAEARVDAAQVDVDDAQAAFATARDEFCSSSKALIDVLDRYGQILDQDAVTVGAVRTGAADLKQSRTEAGTSADAAIKARDQLDAANEALTTAAAELDAARAADTSSTTGSVPKASETVTTATTAPPIPEEVTNRVEQSESDFADAANGVDDATPVSAASVELASASYAVEFAWLQLFAAAGCLDENQQAEAVAAVAEYTAALQTELQVAGYYTGKVDGVYGPQTVAAVEALQEDAGLPVTGLVDGPTEQALDTALQAKSASAATAASSHNAAIQGALKVLGYWDGPIDGAWSDELGAAISKLQGDLGIEQTGVVDAATLHALEEALAAAKTSQTTTTILDNGASSSTSIP
jgi:peptidoglycan hydrolase-like protein with peptidoglycan-binding domain